MDLNTHGFRSRRSYPALNHVSLAPLTPRFPIDDDVSEDYFSPRNEGSEDHPYDKHRTSYLSSYSVPGTPGVLSHSRSDSRARHSKSSSRHLSDTNLQAQDDATPLHHNGKKRRSATSRHQISDPSHRDSEWMLRAGIALASSTREEKGQSWLAKRESSTSLVSDMNYDETSGKPSGRANRRSRSGMSTPAANSAYSRRGSRSLAASRRSSRPDLGFTMTSASGIQSPAGDARTLVPDFVDERIRAEMASIQQDEDDYASESDESESADEIDELELQNLTRERGFGLGSWVDRVVEWTLFGVDEWPSSLPSVVRFSSPPSHEAIPDNQPSREEDDGDGDDGSSVAPTEDGETASVKDNGVSEMPERPGEVGGWEDAGWFFRAIKRALI